MKCSLFHYRWFYRHHTSTPIFTSVNSTNDPCILKSHGNLTCKSQAFYFQLARLTVPAFNFYICHICAVSLSIIKQIDRGWWQLSIVSSNSAILLFAYCITSLREIDFLCNSIFSWFEMVLLLDRFATTYTTEQKSFLNIKIYYLVLENLIPTFFHLPLDKKNSRSIFLVLNSR